MFMNQVCVVADLLQNAKARKAPLLMCKKWTWMSNETLGVSVPEQRAMWKEDSLEQPVCAQQVDGFGGGPRGFIALRLGSSPVLSTLPSTHHSIHISCFLPRAWHTTFQQNPNGHRYCDLEFWHVSQASVKPCRCHRTTNPCSWNFHS